MRHMFRSLHARPVPPRKGRGRPLALSLAALFLPLSSGAAQAASRDAGTDITAPPMALLLAMAALGLFLGRRK
ncbi:MAG: hypothetical protein QM690_00245 [Sphingobium sp.]